MDKKLLSAVEVITDRIPQMPELAIVLGSGFRAILSSDELSEGIGFDAIPGCASPNVPGHESAAIVLASLGGRRVVLVSGRMHYYEGHSMETITLPVRALARAGVRKLLLTNAAGGIAPGMQVGDLMCFVDHINMIGENPLRGPLGAGGTGFVDLTHLYSQRMNRLIKECSSRHGFTIHDGVYVGVSGPSFETPAEIRMFERLGGDAVGMSTIPEAIAARQAGLEVGGLSFITNHAAGKGAEEIKHDDVMDALRQAGTRLAAVLTDFCRHEGCPEIEP